MTKQVLRSRPGSGWSGRGGSGSGSSSGSSGTSTRTGSTGSTTTGVTRGDFNHDFSNADAVLEGGVQVPRGQSSQLSFIDYLTTMLGGKGNDFTALLSNLGAGTGDVMSDAQKKDWNKQIMDMLLQYALTQEQRGYNLPVNQLARLMGAGIGRDAALQMLSGSGDGSGSGAAALPASAIPATQSELNDIQGKTAIANTVFNGISTLSGLVNLGFSIPQAIQQTQLLKYQNFLTGSQVAAYQQTGKAFSILKRAGAAADSFGSVGSAISAMVDLAKGGNAEAEEFIKNGYARQLLDNSAFASRTLGELYRSERSSSDYAREYENSMRQMEADAALQEIQFDAVLQEILQSEAEIEKILADADFQRANKEAILSQAKVFEEQADLLKKQGKLVDAQRALAYAEALKADAETQSLKLQNNVEQTFQDMSFGSAFDPKANRNGVQLLAANRWREIYQGARILAKTNNETYYNAVANNLLSTADNITAVNLLSTLRSTSDVEFATKNPSLCKFGWALEDCGLNTRLTSGKAGRMDIKGIPFKTKEFDDLNEVLEGMEREQRRDERQQRWDNRRKSILKHFK